MIDYNAFVYNVGACLTFEWLCTIHCGVERRNGGNYAKVQTIAESLRLEDNDEFWLKQTTLEYTLELAGYVRKSNSLIKIFEKLSAEVFASKNAIEIYDSFKQRQAKQLSENGKIKELQEMPVTVINLFKDDKLRYFRVKGDKEETILEESSVEIRLDMLVVE